MGKVSSGIVFTLSVSACVLLLALERNFGVDIHFHPDVKYYQENFHQIVELVKSSKNYFNNAIYFIYDIFDGDISYLIFVNIIAYAFTNILVLKAVISHEEYSHRKITYLLIIILILSPYRLHIAITGLKDTLLILILSAGFYYRRTVYITILLALFFRSSSTLYFLFHFKNKIKKSILFFLILCVSIFTFFERRGSFGSTTCKG